MKHLPPLAPRKTLLLLALMSGGMLAGALIAQYGFGLWPCSLCLWQRWPHWLMLGLGGVSLVSPPKSPVSRGLLGLAALTMLVSGGLGFWHSGVETGVLPGPGACSGGLSLTGDASAVLDRLLTTAPPRCDEIVWSFLGLSMATWNGLISLAMAGAAVLVWRASAPGNAAATPLK